VQLLQISDPSPRSRRFASESSSVPQVLHRKQLRCHRFPAAIKDTSARRAPKSELGRPGEEKRRRLSCIHDGRTGGHGKRNQASSSDEATVRRADGSRYEERGKKAGQRT